MRLENLELPENLYWKNEFSHKSIAQSSDRTVSGGTVYESQILMYGQKITLVGAWATRAEIVVLKALESSGSVNIFTSNSGELFSTVFDIESGGLSAELVGPEINPDSETLYELIINLLTVEPV